MPARVEAEDLPKLQEGLAKLRRQHTDIARINYFPSTEGIKVTARLAQAAQALVETASPAVQVPMADAASYQNRRWVTRPRPHVDRLACIWLIRRFLDPFAVIVYGTPSQPNDVTFDMQDAEFGHTGNLCTFETMLRAFNLDEPALGVLAQIVHEIDLRDGLYARPETAGIDSVLAGWLAADLPDLDLETHGIALFDGIHAALSQSMHASEPSGITGGER
jgi:hypothetical protein